MGSNDYIASLLPSYLERLSLSVEEVKIPLRSDLSEYAIEDLQIDQKESLADVLYAVQQYCLGMKINEDNLLRITVTGVAGSGKSTWINTLVTIIRKMFPQDNIVSVFAPTGCAAFNAGGETLHKGFKLQTLSKDSGLSANTTQFLLSHFAKTLMIIIDERSMVDATILAMAKGSMQQCAHQGTNKKHPWGGIPIIILVGDDFQLPPIMPGAFYALQPRTRGQNVSNIEYAKRMAGLDEFIEMGKTVINLVGEKRVNNGQDQFKRILQAVRSENELEKMLEEDAETLLKCYLSRSIYSEAELKQIHEEATYVFANKEPRDQLNNWKLLLANSETSPVARMKSKTSRIATRGPAKNYAYNSHYDSSRQPTKVLLCKGARVALNGYNPDPKHGLFHGSLGIVRDIVYDVGDSPTSGSLPAYVLVEFYQYCGEELIPNMPRHVPIVPITVGCNKPFRCCQRTYIPLSLAYGKTAHTFQGQNVGPVPEGRPQNAIQKIIVDPGMRQFEGINVGLLYQLLSCATSIRDGKNKLSSAIYFHGTNFSRPRFENLTRSNVGKKEPYKMALWRGKWVQYLQQHTLPKGRWNADNMASLFVWATTMRFDTTQLSAIIQTQNI